MDHLDVGNADDEKDSSARRPKVKRPELAPTLFNIYLIHFKACFVEIKDLINTIMINYF